MSNTVRLGSITFGGGPDGDGDNFVLTEVEGWEFPQVDMASASRADDGDVLSRLRLGGRAITLVGTASTSSIDNVWRVRKKLATAVGALVRAAGTLYVDEASVGALTQASVRVSQPMRVKRYGPYAVQFEIPLMAFDPRKYAQTATTSSGSALGAVAVTNDGNYPSPPTLVIHGASTNPRVTNAQDGSKMLKLQVAIAGGASATIDVAARTITHSSGASWYQYLTTDSQWWELYPGVNNLTFASDSGGTLDVSFRSAYI